MRFLSTIFFFHLTVCFFLQINAQELTTQRCVAENLLLEIFESKPSKLEIFRSQEDAINELISKNNLSFQRSVLYVPVIVHVVYREEDQNISDLQIYDQIDILNNAFSARNLNLHHVPQQFRPLIGDVGIQFCLAKVDEHGNSTKGIIRTKTALENIGTTRIDGIKVAVHFEKYGGSDPWNPEKYLNIWISEMENNIAGSATFPGMAPYPEADGIIINYRYFGSIGSASQSAPYDKGKTLVHEVGHYFNLFHPWGPGFGGCDSDDFVDDTPLQEGPYFVCMHSDNYSCGSEDLVVNFMDYTEDECLAMFTHGQKERMLASIQLFRAELINNQLACNKSDYHQTENPKDFRIVKPESIDKIYIYSPDGEVMDFSLELYDLTGKKIWENQLSQTSFHQLDISGLNKGIYIVCINAKDNYQCARIPVF